MARRAEEEENHWPGFVDALSTIVMVVTFLLIILGIVIFVISLQINDPSASDDIVEKGTQIAELQQELADVIQVVSQQTEVIEGQEKEIEDLTETAIQSSAIDNGNTSEVQAQVPIIETEIVVLASKEQTQSSAGLSQIETAQAVMTVRFETGAVELDETSKSEALNFLEENNVVSSENNILVISYFDGQSISVSQEKRTAYYRLLSVRNALLDSGVEGNRITINVTPAVESVEGAQSLDRVKVFLQ